jgi:hypothetical protein
LTSHVNHNLELKDSLVLQRDWEPKLKGSITDASQKRWQPLPVEDFGFGGQYRLGHRCGNVVFIHAATLAASVEGPAGLQRRYGPPKLADWLWSEKSTRSPRPAANPKSRKLGIMTSMLDIR